MNKKRAFPLGNARPFCRVISIARGDDGFGRDHGVLGDHYDAVAHKIQIVGDVGTAREGLDDHARPQARVTAVDASADALTVARANAGQLGLAVTLHHGDWLAPVAGERFDLIVSNPPYIAEGDAHLPALAHEPRSALVSGADGLDDLRRIVATAPAHLAPGGWLLLEHGWDQAAAVRALLTDAGFTQVQSRRDLAGIERCSGGCHCPSVERR